MKIIVSSANGEVKIVKSLTCYELYVKGREINSYYSFEVACDDFAYYLKEYGLDK